MSNITRWEPFRDLVSVRKDMDRLFDEFFTMPTAAPTGWSMPMVDMYQTEDDIVVKATLPGPMMSVTPPTDSCLTTRLSTGTQSTE